MFARSASVHIDINTHVALNFLLNYDFKNICKTVFIITTLINGD